MIIHTLVDCGVLGAQPLSDFVFGGPNTMLAGIVAKFSHYPSPSAPEGAEGLLSISSGYGELSNRQREYVPTASHF